MFTVKSFDNGHQKSVVTSEEGEEMDINISKFTTWLDRNSRLQPFTKQSYWKNSNRILEDLTDYIKDEELTTKDTVDFDHFKAY